MADCKISFRQLNLFLFCLLSGIILFHTLFPEFNQKESTEGWVWDSTIYTRMVQDFKYLFTSHHINSYYFQRVFPTAVIFSGLTILGISLTVENIVTAFIITNIALIGIAFYGWMQLCQILRLGTGNRLLSFTGIFVNYAILKMPFYYPLLNDLFAFTIGILMLYCFFKKYTTGLVCLSVAGAFCFPTLFYCGMLLYVFPSQRQPVPSIPAKPVWNKWLAIVAVAGFIFVWLFARFIKYKPYINPVEEALFPVSVVLALGYIYLTITSIAQPAHYLQESMKKNTWLRAIVVLVLLLLIRAFILYFASPEESVLNFKGFFSNIVLEAITNPLVFIVAHFVYFGPVLLLLIYFRKSFLAEVNAYGTGLHLFILIFLLVGIGSESRQFINAWPVFVIVLCAALEKYSFPPLFYLFIGLMALALSKFWYRINLEPFYGDILAFPYQHYFMSQGPWMSDNMYYLQGSIMLIVGVLLYILFLRKPVQQYD